ncbi:SMI1/KNR4 family protein [Helicobacter rodentium]|uniref:SMI1/KNR4 family protein n=1 Tax=Helicobacter rodentium TaxID=59617 RepID=UPI0025A66DEF|nr:SMI1/KNR4 family protein [Helicobacter rodentium]
MDIVYGVKGDKVGFLCVEDLKIQDDFDLKLKKEIVEFLLKTNAGSPKNRELTINEKIYIFNNVLNFNQDAKLENVREYIKNLSDVLDNEMPFGRDGFGNVYLVDLDSLLVRFYEYEKNNKTELMLLGEFSKILGVDNGI